MSGGPLVVGAAGEDDLAAALEESGGELDVVLHGPAAEDVVTHHVAGTGRSEDDSRARWAGGQSEAGQLNGLGRERHGRSLSGEFAVGASVDGGGEDAEILARVAAAREQARGAVGVRETELARGTQRQSEQAIAGVVVESGAEVIARAGKTAPEGEHRGDALHAAAAQQAGVVYG